MDTQNLIQTVIDRRKELGLTQVQVAEYAHVSRRAVIDFESGNNSISLRRLSRILGSLNMTLSVKPGGPRPSESELRDLFRDDDE